jgi:hypothetical protein
MLIYTQCRNAPRCAGGAGMLFVVGHMLADNFHFVFRFHFVEKPRGAQLSTAIHALVFCEEGLRKCDNLTCSLGCTIAQILHVGLCAN